MNTNNKDKILPVDKQKYASRTYWKTGQPYRGLGSWLLYQEDKLQKENQ